MRIVHVALDAKPTPGEWVSSVDLLIRRPDAIRSTRHLLHFTDENGWTRREAGGPIEPGPWGFLLERRVLPVPEPPTRKVDPGDVLEVRGELFAVAPDVGGQLILQATDARAVALSTHRP